MSRRKTVWVIALVVCCVALFLSVGSSSPDELRVVCVPWNAQNVSIPHTTWDGKQITLKGTVRGVPVGETFFYEWDFGDGSPVVTGSGTNPYIIEAAYTYNGPIGKLFAAKLSVTYNGTTAIGNYLVQVQDGNDLKTKVNVAIDEGLWRLHKEQVRGTYPDGADYGYWNYGYPVAATGACIEAFEVQGHLPEGNIDKDPYVETVQRGLNYLLAQTRVVSVPIQEAGNPDTNGNGIGLACDGGQSSYECYICGITTMTFASSKAPERIAQTGDATYVKGRKYKDIVQDMVDFIAYAQTDPSCGVYRGGWRYYANYGSSDNSVSQWPVIGLEAAETTFGGAGVTVPQFVRDELSLWVTYVQNPNGGSGYDWPEGPNVARTGGLLCEFKFLGDDKNSTQVINAISYVGSNWGEPAATNYYTIANYYAMYSVMKGLRLLQIERIPDGFGGSFDWYGDPVKGMATRLVNSQNNDGHWTANSYWANPPLSTAWAILILSPTVIEPVPVANAGPDKIGVPPIIELKFDASGSYHGDPNKSIIEYCWDFDASNGVDWNNPDLRSSVPICKHAFPAFYNPDGSIDWNATAKEYIVTLRVKDNSVPIPMYSTDTCVVTVTLPPWQPIAEAGGPYKQLKDQVVVLDGSASHDPNGELLPPDHPWYSKIEKWEWDFDNDGHYDAVGEKVPHTWSQDGTYVVSLRVTNTLGVTATDDALVIIGEQEEWSFAIITDLHIGRGYPEYNGEDYYLKDYLKERLEKVVDWINANRKNEKIKFLVVLGDIADNSEYSKLAKAKQILDRLEEIPYFPVLGNHDVWSDGKANGDSNFNEIFDETFFRDSATKLGTKWRNGRTIERLGGVLVDEDSYLQNYAFVYNDVTFVALDFVARTKPLRVLPVGNPVAVGHESTMQWLNMCLAIGKPTILLSHHPMAEKGLIEVEGYGVIDYAFNYSDVIRIGDIIWGSGTEVLANFAGHLHGWSTKFLNILRHTHFMDANKDYKEDGYFTPYGIRAVVTTEAVMVASNDPTEPYVIGSNYPTPKGTEKGVIRIVKMRGNEIVLPSLVEGFFPALNPSFDAGWPDLSLAGVGLHFLRKTPIKFEAYAFTKMFTQEHPLTYVMNFGDSQAEPKSATGGEVPFEHTYDNGGKYNVTLLVKGQTPEGEIIREEITQEINVSDFGIFGLSPIDIIVTDPDGLTISKQLNQIPEAIYTETDFNGDGDPDDVILIPHRKIGNYVITVIPEPGAAPTDTYTLEVLVDGVSILLADKVQISNIPALPYVIRATETGVIPIIPATVDFDPDTLNLKSKGQWVTVYIELPVGHGYAVSQLDVSSIRLNGQVHAEAKPTKVGDYDKDGIPDLMVKFDRAAVQAILQVGDHVEITINGRLLCHEHSGGCHEDGRLFEGKDTIRVILPRCVRETEEGCKESNR